MKYKKLIEVLSQNIKLYIPKHTTFDVNYKTLELIITDEISQNIYYDNIENKIFFSSDLNMADKIKNLSIKEIIKLPNIVEALTHEIIHATNATVYSENCISSGFDNKVEFSKYNALTEGFTQLETCNILKKPIKENIMYYQEVLILCQLLNVIDYKNMQQSYYFNQGINTQIKEIQAVLNIPNLGQELFMRIEDNHQYTENQIPSEILADIQGIIIELLFNKLEQKNYTLDKKLKIINNHKKYLITTNTIQTKFQNSNINVGVNDAFYYLQAKENKLIKKQN